jgi:hypothetical protein
MSSPSPLLPLPPYAAYRLSRGETHVFSSTHPYVTYKAALLPLWRFRTPTIARTSAAAIYERFLAYNAEDDFVGMDMCRKYLQMGMTRAKRYANYSGGRKYVEVKGEEGEEDGEEGEEREEGVKGVKGAGKVQKEKSEGHQDQKEKEEASQIFRGVWERARKHEGYVEKKKVFLEKQKAWDRVQKRKNSGKHAKSQAEPEIKAEGGMN